MYQRIIADFDAALASESYQKAGSAADLSLAVTIGAQQKTDIESWGRFGLQTSVHQYTKGQLSLDVFDTKPNERCGTGRSAKPSIRQADPAAVDKAITKLMRCPPTSAAGSAPGRSPGR